jgi:hypothetical protein
MLFYRSAVIPIQNCFIRTSVSVIKLLTAVIYYYLYIASVDYCQAFPT